MLIVSRLLIWGRKCSHDVDLDSFDAKFGKWKIMRKEAGFPFRILRSFDPGEEGIHVYRHGCASPDVISQREFRS